MALAPDVAAPRAAGAGLRYPRMGDAANVAPLTRLRDFPAVVASTLRKILHVDM